MRARYTTTLAVVTAAIVAIIVSGCERKQPVGEPPEQAAAITESSDEEAAVQQQPEDGTEESDSEQNQQAPSEEGPSVVEAEWQPYGKRYAIIVMSDGANSDEYFWPVTKSMYGYLREMGFGEENIRFLAPEKYAADYPETVFAEASEANVEQAYEWAGAVCTSEDLLYVFWISHGTESDFTTAGDSVKHSTLAGWMEDITARRIIGVYQPCLSGAVVDDISGEGVITTTSTDAAVGNNWPWAENMAFALAGVGHCDEWMNENHEMEPAKYVADQDDDGQVSVTEAYIWVAKHRYTEGSTFDDNGDGVGGQWGTDTLDPNDPGKDGYIGEHFSLRGWRHIGEARVTSG